MKKYLLLLALIPVAFIAFINADKTEVVEDNSDVRAAAQKYLDAYNLEYQKLYTASAEGQWVLLTHIVEGDTMSSYKAGLADEAFAKFTGSLSVIDSAKKYLAIKNKLTPLQAKQFEVILFNAGNNPESAGDVVKKRIDATNQQQTKLYEFKYMLNGKQVTTNDIDRILRESTEMKERLAAWNASKEVGVTLKDGLANLQQLRNASVAPLGYSDFFSYMVSEYGMTSDQMLELTHSMIRDVWPLYRELHTWARYELAEKYHQPVPDYLPADWLPNRWGQDWTAMVNVEGTNIDDELKKHDPEWILKQGEAFWMSMGFQQLPQTFWEKSSLYPVAPDAGYSKNNHASAWHMDLDQDVRSLMSVETNTEWWSTVLHELGHIYYYLQYANPDVPMVLRTGANRAYHEGFGTMMGLASLQKPLLESRGLLPAGTVTNDTLKLLSEALDYIVHIPWGSGVMTEFEYNLYAKNLDESKYNQLWWDLAKKYQGIIPPAERKDADGYCDAATKTHINDDPAGYYDYSISEVFLFQVHTYIAQNILHQDPHATNYWGNKGVGDFLKPIMAKGETEDWRQLMKESIGSDLSAKPMVDYFAPLMEYLKKVNAGRKYTLPEKPSF